MESSVGELPPTTYPWWGADVIIISHLSHLLPPSMQLLTQSIPVLALSPPPFTWRPLGKKNTVHTRTIGIFINSYSTYFTGKPVSTLLNNEKTWCVLAPLVFIFIFINSYSTCSQENGWSPPVNEHWNTDQQQSIKLNNKVLVYN